MRFFRWLFPATLTLVMLLQLNSMDTALRTPETPWGMIGYQLAFTPERAAGMLGVWKSRDLFETLRVSLGFDGIFLVVYPLFLSISVKGLLGSTRLAARRMLIRSGGVLRWLVLLCIPLDATENVLLWLMMDSTPGTAFTLSAGVMASGKFLLVALTLGWCLSALALRQFSPGKDQP